MTKQLPRGIRNNNPGNVEDDGKTPWQGLDTPRNDGRFLRAKTPADGVRILARVLITYQDKRRAPDGSAIDTAPEFINRFAPPNENDTDAYIDGVCDDIGVTRRGTIDIHEYKTAKAMVVAITAHENANYRYPDDVIDQGLSMAGIRNDATLAKKSAAPAASLGVGTIAVVAGYADDLGPVVPFIKDSLEYASQHPSAFVIGLGLLLAGLAAFVVWQTARAHKLGIA